MPTEATSEVDVKTVEKVQKLVALAADGSNEQESASAMAQAVKLIKEHDLRIVSAAQLDHADKIVREARELVREAKAENRKQLMLGALGGFLLSGGKLPKLF
jgi:hypothetical protein